MIHLPYRFCMIECIIGSDSFQQFLRFLIFNIVIIGRILPRRLDIVIRVRYICRIGKRGKAEKDRMILSVSRRTDIPHYYADWFLERIKEGYLYVRNPRNAHQISKIILSPETVDCIVFWTKNPEPLLSRLGELDAYPYYFQFTLTGYGRDMEAHIPHKKQYMIPIFQTLSQKIGKEKVIWRYDPIFFTDRYTPAYHIRAFRQIAEALCGYTLKCVISFGDLYPINQNNMKAFHTFSLEEDQLFDFGEQIARIADSYGMQAATCAETADLSGCGIEHNSCIDPSLIERIIGCRLNARKDPHQRRECGCMESVDVGTYHTCKGGCRYCYANGSQDSVFKHSSCYDVHAPLLCGRVTELDQITERKALSFRDKQLTIWDRNH